MFNNPHFISTRYTKSLILLLILFLVGSWYIRERNRYEQEGYLIVSSLDADLVYQCQAAAKSYGLDWSLLVSFYLQTQPKATTEEIMNQAAVIKESASEIRFFKSIFDEHELKLMLFHARQIKRFGYYFSPQYVFPVQSNLLTYRNTWGADRDSGKRKHQGTDIFAKQGTPIISITAGRIEKLGWNRLGGKRVGIRDIHGNYLYYAHLSDYRTDLNKGDSVLSGEIIGYMGDTGNAKGTPDHLHLGIMTHEGQWINPYHFLQYWSKYSKKNPE